MKKILIVFILLLLPFSASAVIINGDNVEQQTWQNKIDEIKAKANEYWLITQQRYREARVIADEYWAKGKSLMNEYFGPNAQRKVEGAVDDMKQASDKIKSELKK